jgi:hypothetical protein
VGVNLLVVFFATLYGKKTLRREEQKCMPSCNIEWVNGHMKKIYMQGTLKINIKNIW